MTLHWFKGTLSNPTLRIAALALVVGLPGLRLHAQSLEAKSVPSMTADAQLLRQDLQNLQMRVGQLETQAAAGHGTPVAPAAYTEATEQTVTGRVSCAALTAGLYRCSKNQPAWGCTLQCIDAGSHYVLETGHSTYDLSGDTAQLHRFAADKVVVTGEFAEGRLKVDSIATR